MSIPLDKIVLRSRDPVFDLTVSCVMSQPPSDRVSTQSSSDCIDIPSDCPMSQPSVSTQSSSDGIALELPFPMSQPSTDCVMSQPPSDCVVSRPPSDCVSTQLSSDCIVLEPYIVSQPPSDCVMSQPPSDDDTFKVQCTDKDMDQTSLDEVLATRLRFSSEPEHTKRCGRKRKRKCVSVPELPVQQEQYNNNMTVEEEEEMVVVSKGTMSDHLPVINMMLHQRGLWTSTVSI